MYLIRKLHSKISYLLFFLICASFLITYHLILGRQTSINHTTELFTINNERTNEHYASQGVIEKNLNMGEETSNPKKNGHGETELKIINKAKLVSEFMQTTKGKNTKSASEETTKSKQIAKINFIIPETTKLVDESMQTKNGKNIKSAKSKRITKNNFKIPEQTTRFNLVVKARSKLQKHNSELMNNATKTNQVPKIDKVTTPTVTTEKHNLDDDARVITPGCTIPEMDAWDPSIKPFIYKEKDFNCNNGTPPLCDFNETSVFVLKSSLPHYRVIDLEKLKCCYQPFHRVNPPLFQRDNIVKFDPKCYEFNESTVIEKHEYINVSCYYNQELIYKDYFYFIRVKDDVKPREASDESLNVLVIGIDGVSRLNFLRQMPKTANLINTLGAVSMYGFNKIDDNSFPNQVPILTGLTAAEIKATCWPIKNKSFDKCHFIWNDFKRLGYETAFCEDAADVGLFYMDAMGFTQQPTDHHWNQFYMMSDIDIGSNRGLVVTQCMGSTPTYQQLLGYTSRLVDVLSTNRKKFFAYLWGSSLSHDYLNKPQLGDVSYVQLLTEFSQSGVLNNTVLIFMSDHGTRYGDIRATYQGMMEERLPYLYILLPKWYKEKHALLYNNLKSNQRRLVTPLDLYETIKDLLNSRNLTDDFIKKRDEAAKPHRSYSLFQNITAYRTCEDAGIAPHWCTCQSSVGIASNDSNVVNATEFTIGQINDILKIYPKCAVLELDTIIQARLNVNNKNILLKKLVSDYTITFKTKPGGALFEATVRKQVNESNVEFNLAGSVSRINVYGNQSSCVTDKRHKLYCYCKT